MMARMPNGNPVCRTHRTLKLPLTCLWCRDAMIKLCDFPIGRGDTCNAPMCETHAKSIGHNVDLCPTHAGHRPVL